MKKTVAVETLPKNNEISEAAFWNKVKGVSKRAGKEVLNPALTLFYTLKDSDTPLWARTAITGALAYFILPSDLIPDFLPGGYVDDLATLTAALGALHGSIKQQHKEQAETKLNQWYGV